MTKQKEGEGSDPEVYSCNCLKIHKFRENNLKRPGSCKIYRKRIPKIKNYYKLNQTIEGKYIKFCRHKITDFYNNRIDRKIINNVYNYKR